MTTKVSVSLKENIFKIIALALPICASNSINMLGNFVAMRMVAELGTKPLAAGALATSTFVTIITITTCILYAIGILISHNKGKQLPPAETGKIVKNGFWLALILSIPASLAFWNADKLLLLAGQDPELVSLCAAYFKVIAFDMLPIHLNTAILQYFISTNRQRFSLVLSLSTFPLTIIASYGFIQGNFGLPALGLQGLACANLLVHTLAMIVVLLYIYFSKKDKPYKLFESPLLPSKDICKSIFLLGLPIGVQFGGEIGAMMVNTIFTGYFGVTALAAAQVVGQYSMLIIMVILGLSQAVSLLVSEAFGSKQLMVVKTLMKAGLIILGIYFIVIFFLFCGIPAQLMHFFVESATITAEFSYLTIAFFQVAAFVLLAEGIRILISAALRGLHDSTSPMRIGIVTLWLVSLPVSYYVGFIWDKGPIGLRIGFGSGFLVSIVLLWWRLHYQLKNLHHPK